MKLFLLHTFIFKHECETFNFKDHFHKWLCISSKKCKNHIPQHMNQQINQSSYYFTLKHTLILLFCILAPFSVSAQTSFDHTNNGITLTYDVVDDIAKTCKVSKCSQNVTGNVIIPQSIDYNNNSYIVVGIGDYAFIGCGNITSVTIPYSITSIGMCAFSGCKGLSTVSIPNSVISIGDYAFSQCSGLTSIIISNSVSTISEYMFLNCNALISVTIPSSTTSIGKSAFNNCSKLTSIIIPNSVKSIGERAFSGCSGLTKVEIPDEVSSIGDYAFENCSCLTSLTLSNFINTISNGAFSGCNNLTMVSIPYAVSTIGDYAFSGCSSLTSVDIAQASNIGEYAFSGCGCLTSINLPNSVSKVSSSAFDGCVKLSAINVANDNSFFSSVVGVLYNKDKTTLWRYPQGKDTRNFEIPNSVKTIHNGAFLGCTNLLSVKIPNSVTSIEMEAFQNCSALTSITIPNSVTSIEANMFNNCHALTSVIIPNSITYIGSGAFYQCISLSSIELPNSVTSIEMGAFLNCSALTSITIPNSVTKIGLAAFFNCTNLKSVSIPNTIKTIENRAFKECPNIEEIYYNADNLITTSDDLFSSYIKPTLYIRPSALDKIKETTPWNLFSNIKVIDFSKFRLDTNDFSMPVNDTATLKVIKGGDVSELSWTSSNPEVATVDSNGTVRTLSSGTATITVSAIDNNSNTTLSATCTIKVYSLQYSFDDSNYTASVIDFSANNLVDVVIPEYVENNERQYKVTSIGNYAFSNNRNLKSIKLPNTISTIGIMAFRRCINLTSITIPNSVISIENFAFENCYNLSTVEIPNSVVQIGVSIFFNCTKLSSINVANDNHFFCSVDGVLYNKDKTKLLQYPQGKSDISFHIPNSVKSIEKFALLGNNLISITVPHSVTEICASAIICPNLKSIMIPNSVTSIGNGAFKSCLNLEKVLYETDTPVTASEDIFFDYTIPTLIVKSTALNRIKNTAPWNKFEKIEIYDFNKTANLVFEHSSINMCTDESAVLNVIQDGHMSELSWVSSNPTVVIVDNGTVTALSIGEASITVSATDLSKGITVSASCDVLVQPLRYSYDSNTYSATVTGLCANDIANIVIPEYVEYDGHEYIVTEIGSSAFFDKKDLVSITIPNTVTRINGSAFRGCNNLSSVTMSNSLTTIGNFAFYECHNLNSITLPNTLTLIGDGAFSMCSSLTSVAIPNTVTSLGDGVFQQCSSLTSATLPISITSIGNNLFGLCSSLTTIEIPNSVSEILNWAFIGCRSLTSIKIPNSVESIAIGAFKDCSGLISIEIPNSVTTIKASAFGGCSSLKSLTIPNSITQISEYVFKDCNALEKIYYNTDYPITANENVFSDYTKATLFVKASALDKIKETTPWRFFSKIETYDFAKLDAITIDGNSIDWSAPYEVYNLSGMMLGDSTDGLRPGIYIVRQGNRAEKISVR